MTYDLSSSFNFKFQFGFQLRCFVSANHHDMMARRCLILVPSFACLFVCPSHFAADVEILGKQCAAVLAVGVLCRCRSGMEVLGGTPLGTRAKTSSRPLVEMGSSPLSPVPGGVSPLEDEIWRQCSPAGVVQDSILVPSGFNWFIIVLNSRCESVESGDLSSS